MEGTDKHWRGSPLDISDGGIDHRGVQEVMIEFDNGDEDVFRPKRREEFMAYELHMMAAYLDSIAHSIRKGKKS